MEEYECIGGPYDGSILFLETPGTIEFKVGNFKGYYNEDMIWVDTNG